jgi:hypothetical protein
MVMFSSEGNMAALACLSIQIRNECETISLLHAIANASVDIPASSPIGKFFDRCKSRPAYPVPPIILAPRTKLHTLTVPDCQLSPPPNEAHFSRLPPSSNELTRLLRQPVRTDYGRKIIIRLFTLLPSFEPKGSSFLSFFAIRSNLLWIYSSQSPFLLDPSSILDLTGY